MSSPQMSAEELHDYYKEMDKWPVSRNASPTTTINDMNNTPLHPYQGQFATRGDSSSMANTHPSTGQGGRSSANHFHQGHDADGGDSVSTDPQSDRETVVLRLEDGHTSDGGILISTDGRGSQTKQEFSEVPTGPNHHLHYPQPHETNHPSAASTSSPYNNGRQGALFMTTGGLPTNAGFRDPNYTRNPWDHNRGAVPDISQPRLPGYQYVNPFPINGLPSSSAAPPGASMADPTQVGYYTGWPTNNGDSDTRQPGYSVPSSSNVNPSNITDARAYSNYDLSPAQLEAVRKDIANLPSENEMLELNGFLESLQGVPDEDLLEVGARRVNEAQQPKNVPSSNCVNSSAVNRGGGYQLRAQFPRGEFTGSTNSSDTVAHDLVFTPQATTGGPQQPAAGYIDFARDPQSVAATLQERGNRLQSQVNKLSQAETHAQKEAAYWREQCEQLQSLRLSENQAAQSRMTELQDEINYYRSLHSGTAQNSEANTTSLKDLTERFDRLNAYAKKLSRENTTLKTANDDLQRQKDSFSAREMQHKAKGLSHAGAYQALWKEFEKLTIAQTTTPRELDTADGESDYPETDY